jgi:hypothetical protein
MTLAQKIYLELLVASEYQDQQPEYINARWYHLLYFLIPIIGIMIFVEAVRAVHKHSAVGG